MKLYSIIKKRKPVIVVLVGLLMGPLFGLAYVNRFLLGAVYTALLFSISYLFEQEWFLQNSNYEILSYIFAGIAWLIYLVAVFHAYYLAKNKYHAEAAKKYTSILPAIMAALFIFTAIAIPFKIFLLENFYLPSPSMAPNFEYYDTIYAKKYAYGYSRYSLPFNAKLWEGRIFAKTPERGDIIVFDLPSNPDVAYIKRVVGLPNDRVQMINGKLHLNGEALKYENNGEYELDGKKLHRQTEYISDTKSYDILSISDNENCDNMNEMIVPEGHVFVLGDNRGFSRDSRDAKLGTIPMEYIIGQVIGK